MLNFKSILFKTKYYPISYKLKFILKSNLSLFHISKCVIPTPKILNLTYYITYAKNRFVFKNIKCVNNSENTTRYYEFNKLHRDNKPAVVNYYSTQLLGYYTRYKIRFIKYDHKGRVLNFVEYYQNGVNVSQGDLPCYIEYSCSGSVQLEEYYSSDGSLHRINRPARIEYENNGTIHSEKYYENNKLHRLNGPAKIKYHKNGNIKSETYYIEGVHKRDNKPAKVKYYDNGNIKYEKYYENGKLHRHNQPAVIRYNKDGSTKNVSYYKHGQFRVKYKM